MIEQAQDDYTMIDAAWKNHDNMVSGDGRDIIAFELCYNRALSQ